VRDRATTVAMPPDPSCAEHRLTPAVPAAERPAARTRPSGASLRGMARGATARLFVAADPPSDVREELAEWARETTAEWGAVEPEALAANPPRAEGRGAAT